MIISGISLIFCSLLIPMAFSTTLYSDSFDLDFFLASSSSSASFSVEATINTSPASGGLLIPITSTG